jgi:hypothetical protein
MTPEQENSEMQEIIDLAMTEMEDLDTDEMELKAYFAAWPSIGPLLAYETETCVPLHHPSLCLMMVLLSNDGFVVITNVD